LERAGALVARLADRCEEERLHDPWAVRVGEVGARDEDRVVRGRAGRKLAGTREERRGPVLHRAEQPSVVVPVDRPPGPPFGLGALDPALLVGPAPAARLPPDAVV